MRLVVPAVTLAAAAFALALLPASPADAPLLLIVGVQFVALVVRAKGGL